MPEQLGRTHIMIKPFHSRMQHSLTNFLTTVKGHPELTRHLYEQKIEIQLIQQCIAIADTTIMDKQIYNHPQILAEKIQLLGLTRFTHTHQCTMQRDAYNIGTQPDYQ